MSKGANNFQEEAFDSSLFPPKINPAYYGHNVETSVYRSFTP